MKHIVITGSTRGIGFGLADAFLGLGCSVTLNGRAQANVDEAAGKLKSRYEAGAIFGRACDVRDPEQVQALWTAAQEHYQRVDIWINNAGSSAPQMPAWKLEPGQAQAVVQTNLLGAIYGSLVAFNGMLAQGAGAIYNMEGMGSDGRKHDGLALYGTTKYGLHYFTECLAREAQGTPLIVGALRPGMVITDLILKQYDDRPEDWERAKRVFNIIADRVESVAPWMAAQVLANQKTGAVIQYLTRGKLLKRVLAGPFRKRDIFT
jgi:NAD(P)-dependent dehydrogenase (short-subunit alcohol dehydrogenase family)